MVDLSLIHIWDGLGAEIKAMGFSNEKNAVYSFLFIGPEDKKREFMKMMKEHFTMYSIVVIVSGKCVHVDTEAMCITFAMLPGIGMKENVVTNLFPKRSCRKLSVRS